MKAMLLKSTGPMSETSDPLTLTDVDEPHPGQQELLLRVKACGVCHTELDEIEGRLTPPHLPVILGYEVVGEVEETGMDVTQFQPGDRVGVGWIHSSSGDRHENISEEFRGTGCDHNGGYAEYMTVPERYAYPIPETFE